MFHKKLFFWLADILKEVQSINKQKINKFIYVILRGFLLIGLGYVILYPLFRGFSMSFRSRMDVLNPGVIWIPKEASLEGYKTALEALDYPTTLLNTLKIAGFSTLLQMITCSLVGYGFARFKFRERDIIFSLVLLTLIVPPQISIIAQYVDFRYFDFFGLGRLFGMLFGKPVTVNLLNTGWPFYVQSLFGTGIRSGLFIFIFRQFFKGMPKDLESAAKIDGCSSFYTFLKVMAPNASPAYLTCFLFSFVWYWNDYTLASVLLQRSHKTLSIVLLPLHTNMWSNPTLSGGVMLRDQSQTWPIVNAAAMLTITPVIILYAFTQRYFLESVSSAGIKG